MTGISLSSPRARRRPRWKKAVLLTGDQVGDEVVAGKRMVFDPIALPDPTDAFVPEEFAQLLYLDLDEERQGTPLRSA